MFYDDYDDDVRAQTSLSVDRDTSTLFVIIDLNSRDDCAILADFSTRFERFAYNYSVSCIFPFRQETDGETDRPQSAMRNVAHYGRSASYNDAQLRPFTNRSGTVAAAVI